MSRGSRNMGGGLVSGFSKNLGRPESKVRCRVPSSFSLHLLPRPGDFQSSAFRQLLAQAVRTSVLLPPLATSANALSVSG